MKNIALISILILLLTSCTKEYEQRNVTYLITGLANEYKIAYLNENEETVTETITPANEKEMWSYKWTGKQGDAVYLFTEFTDVGLIPTNFKVRILIDGKVYRDAYGYDQSIGDTLFRVKRAGVIPY